MMPLNYIFRVSPFRLIKCFSVSAAYSKSHYDSLGLSPHATQADIKSAYYKMSMEFHPDKNKGSDEAAQKFRAISDAYEVLGNLKLRKLYDKGILHTAGPQFTQHAEETTQDDPELRFYRSREHRSRAPPPTGKTSIYDFDEWTRMHYGKVFARREAAKARHESDVRRRILDRQLFYTEMSVLGTFVTIIFLTFTYIKIVNYDVVKDENVENRNTHPPKPLSAAK
ncbi:DnaJ-like protein subfamily C member 30 [Zootermopsis nevadensis]|uniref:DnaJ-like protein subfamily C member 30 n=1 Tax=Zootermopsis nevadensis TaxID=136037 RepID=A0A067R0M0_ZOONE|nr:DnaJ-like protein subfamily C member 30 [Zootermopsis nevadensis]